MVYWSLYVFHSFNNRSKRVLLLRIRFSSLLFIYFFSGSIMTCDQRADHSRTLLHIFQNREVCQGGAPARFLFRLEWKHLRAEISSCCSVIGPSAAILDSAAHLIALARCQSCSQNLPPSYQIVLLGLRVPHWLPRRLLLHSNTECVSAAVRCAQAGERWEEPRGTGQRNMDPRKTLLPLLWILLLKLEEDCCAEEGMWEAPCAFGCSVSWNCASQRCSCSTVSLAHLRLSWGRKQVHAYFC